MCIAAPGQLDHLSDKISSDGGTDFDELRQTRASRSEQLRQFQLESLQQKASKQCISQSRQRKRNTCI